MHRALPNLATALALLVLLGCSTPPAPPEATPRPAPPRAQTAEAGVDPATAEGIEAARQTVRSTAEWLARGVDSWFGDKPFKDGGAVTDGRMSVSLLKRQDESADFDLRFNARFRLPNLEKHTYVFIGRDNTREVVSDRPGTFTRQQRQLIQTPADRGFFAGLGRSVNDSVDFRIGFRGGLKPYVQGRYRKPWMLGEAHLAELRQTVFWSLADRLGSTTALSIERAFSPTLAGRWLSAATITQDSRKFEWHSSLGAYQALGAQRLLSIEALATGKQGTGITFTDYGLQSRYEQPIHKDWLLGEVVLGHFWPRTDAASVRGRAWAVGAGLKMRF